MRRFASACCTIPALMVCPGSAVHWSALLPTPGRQHSLSGNRRALTSSGVLLKSASSKGPAAKKQRSTGDREAVAVDSQSDTMESTTISNTTVSSAINACTLKKRRGGTARRTVTNTRKAQGPMVAQPQQQQVHGKGALKEEVLMMMENAAEPTATLRHSPSTRVRRRRTAKVKATAVSGKPAGTGEQDLATPCSSSPSASTSSAKSAKTVPEIPKHTTQSVVYYTETMLKEPALSEEELVAERASVTKLFMVSDAFSSIFNPLPRNRTQLNLFLQQVDSAVVESQSSSSAVASSEEERTGKRVAHDAGSDEDGRVQALPREATEDIVRRVMAEEAANHTLCVHVREMEQLVPPAHLVSSATTSQTPAQPPPPPANKRSNGRRKRGQAVSAVSPRTASEQRPVIPETPPLTPQERMMAFQKWQMEARKRATLSQERHSIPDNYHTITRLRFHDPHKTDAVVVQGKGSPKAPEDVLDLLSRRMSDLKRDGGEDDPASSTNNEGQRIRAGLEEECDTAAGVRSGNYPKYLQSLAELMGIGSRGNEDAKGTSSKNAVLSAPYVMRPLLTVYANCMPRRELLLGFRNDEEVFRTSAPSNSGVTPPSTVANRKQRQRRASGGEAENNSNSSTGTATEEIPSYHPNDITDEEAYTTLQQRGVPMLPRHFTLITLLVEHNEMTPVDLLSLAEISTPRKDATVTTTVGSDSGDGRGNTVGGAEAASMASPKSNCGMPPRMFCLVVDGGSV